MPRSSAIVFSPVPPPISVADADAAVAEVLSPKTFYSVAPPRKTGTMPTVAIVAANDNYPAGYHAGDAGGLDAIDVNLASANIKTGITIFGKAGAIVDYIYALGDLTVFNDAVNACSGDTTSTSYVFIRTLIKILNSIFATTLRLTFYLQSSEEGQAVWARIYRNITAVGTERSTTTSTTFTEDIAGWSVNDLINGYGKATSGYICRFRYFNLLGSDQLFALVAGTY